jgi:type VI secretion system secreted protein Hcp
LPRREITTTAQALTIHDFTVKKKVDKASPTLMLHCANGKHIPNGYMYARKHGTESAVDFLFFKFIDVVITSVQEGGDTTGLHDEVSFAFSSISVEHKGPSGTTSFACDLKANKII